MTMFTHLHSTSHAYGIPTPSVCEHHGPYCTSTPQPADLTTVTISTVGYGDISPSPNAGMRVFTVLYILVGSGYAFGQLANLLSGVLEGFILRVKQLLKRTCGRDRTAATGDGTAGEEVTGRSIGVGGVALDIDGDGIADFIEPPPALVFWAQELLPALLLLMPCSWVEKVEAAGQQAGSV